MRQYGIKPAPIAERRVLRHTATATALAALLLGITGCSDDNDGTESDTAATTAAPSPTTATTNSTVATSTPEPTTDATGSSDTTSPPTAGDLDAAAAADVALQTTPGFVFAIGQGNEGGQPVWEVDVARSDGTGVEHYIAMATGELLDQQSAPVPPEAASAPAVPIQDAIGIAIETVADGVVVEADLGTENSVVIWEILVTQSSARQSELYIDASDGSILKNEIAD